MKQFDGFSDLGDDFDSASVSSEKPQTLEDASGNKSMLPKAKVETEGYKETCKKCRGTGVYTLPSSHGRRCFECDGKGYKLFKTSPEQRQKARESSKQRKEDKAEQAFKAFEAAHPAIAAWWTGSDFPFAVSLREAVRKYGNLTERQLIAAQNCVDKFNAAKAQKAVAQEAATAVAKAGPTLDMTPVQEAMRKAQESGIKRPKMRLAGEALNFLIKQAPVTGRNAGALYVMGDYDTYLGKIADGKFYASRDCSPESRESIIQACQQPLESAVAYGRRTGVCSCCGRELSNQESIDLGIGPICRSKFF